MKPRWMAGAALLAALAGCDDNARSDLVEPGTLAIQAVTASAAGAGSLGLEAYTLGLLADAGRKPEAGSASSAADTLLPGVLTCPVVTAESGGAGDFLLRLDYGDGCVSTLDSVATGGTIEFTVTRLAPSGLELVAEFGDFIRDGRAVDGILEASGRTGQAVTISAQALSMSGRGAAVFLGMELTAQRSVPSAPGTPLAEPATCAIWSVPSGSGSVEGVVGSEEIAFLFSVTDTILVSTCCAYPTAGILRITGAGLIPATVDFGDGSCDNLALLTVAGRSQEISLGD